VGIDEERPIDVVPELLERANLAVS
jgi:hypothetical protein